MQTTNNSGWIKISRDLPNHWLWQDAERLKWWLDLILLAAWEDRKEIVGAKLVELKRGQIIVSRSFLCGRWKRSRTMIETFLSMLIDENMITKTASNNISVITIVNYEKYQYLRATAEASVSAVEQTAAPPRAEALRPEIKKSVMARPVGAADESDDIRAMFEAFRRAYPGTKRGLDVEYENFRRKNPKQWRDIAPMLMPALERLKLYHEQCAAAGRFCPNWKNLATWINQRCWTEELPSVESQRQTTSAKPPTQPLQQNDTSTKINHEYNGRQEQFARHIIAKLAAPDTPESDISGNY